MSEPKKSKRGGKREGAGRKPKGYIAPDILTDLDLKAAEAAATPPEIESAARLHARAAVDSLKTVMVYSNSWSARIRAANAILDRGFGKPSTLTGVDLMQPLFGDEFVKTVPGQIMEEARKVAPTAIAVLRKIADCSTSASARVAASLSLLDRGLGAVSVARLEAFRNDLRTVGKKQRALAEAVSGACGTSWDRLLADRPAAD
jgi:hypothetical protein